MSRWLEWHRWGYPERAYTPVVQPNLLPRADVNTFDNFEFPEAGDDEAGDWRLDVPKEVHVRGGEAPQPQRPRRRRGSRSKPIPQLPEPNELAEYGWEDESQLWRWREARKSVPIRFLLRFWPAHEH